MPGVKAGFFLSEFMTTFATNEDLIKIRSNILNYFTGTGVTIDEFHEQADGYVIQDISIGWYRKVAQDQGFDFNEYPFDIDLILDTSQFKDLACYKCLFLCYRYLAGDMVDDDASTKSRDYFADEYQKELSRLIESGINYDWDSSGVVDDDEKNKTAQAIGSLTAATEW